MSRDSNLSALHNGDALWEALCIQLQEQTTPQQFNTWLRPLRGELHGNEFHLFAPNPFVMQWVRERLMDLLEAVLAELAPGMLLRFNLDTTAAAPAPEPQSSTAPSPVSTDPRNGNRLNPGFSFQSYVEGKSNQLAVAAARQVSEHPGKSYNPLYIYGGVGLGKTHLMQAVGNAILQRNADAKVLYVSAEGFIMDMVRSLQHNTINDFKQRYRKLDALLIDDIQFFAGKDRTQEEFFHTFNALFDGGRQIIITCDRYPKEVERLEERLQSRFGWGLTVAIQPHDLETRMAIVLCKAEEIGIELPEEVAFFIAEKIRSHVRELEGALRRVVAHVNFTHKPYNLDTAREALRDLIDVQKRMVSLENIQKVVAEYFHIRGSDMQSKRRSRNIARPRQVAMSLTKELTNHSLPEIGEAFGGRDHTTVLHACRQIEKLRQEDSQINEDYNNLLRILGA
ncbi:chromosomal replication initiator protein DnaA [Acidithiobacillus sp. RW2]|uniref:Chromosomal replication initiator protein DnaA n=2 Tax=Acidithiobacillus sulfurivorans TaxID=1958756 RepID=A0ABS5ZWB3_9PROT|nr:chromosomal replication initiator protein DnaA [Acidithiobacillus sulfurivorans]